MEADEINNLLAELTAQDETDLLEEQDRTGRDMCSAPASI